jgi:hypothetical protein
MAQKVVVHRFEVWSQLKGEHVASSRQATAAAASSCNNLSRVGLVWRAHVERRRVGHLSDRVTARLLRIARASPRLVHLPSAVG